VNPQADAPAAVITGTAFKEWQQMPYDNPKKFEELKPSMNEAYKRDGGIDWNK
jgi:hypothetical protein